MLKPVLAKVLTAKAAIVLAAVGGGGVAVAAGSGHFPGVGASNDHSESGRIARVPASEQATAAAAHGSPSAGLGASAGAAPGSSGAAAHHVAAPGGSPSPNLRGLCTAFQAGVADNPGKALDNPAFTVLITTAGGKDVVATYCTTLLATPAGASHAPGRSHVHPTSRPSDAPGSHPTGPERAPNHHAPSAPPTHPH